MDESFLTTLVLAAMLISVGSGPAMAQSASGGADVLKPPPHVMPPKTIIPPRDKHKKRVKNHVHGGPSPSAAEMEKHKLQLNQQNHAAAPAQ
jgi:hypothetical protein